MRPADAFAVLKASNVLAAPQAEVRNRRRESPRRFAFVEACWCARRFAARFAASSGTGGNSPLEVESSLTGRRLPSGSMSFMAHDRSAGRDTRSPGRDDTG